jgi:hypothetical protein
LEALHGVAVLVDDRVVVLGPVEPALASFLGGFARFAAATNQQGLRFRRIPHRTRVHRSAVEAAEVGVRRPVDESADQEKSRP